MKIFNVAKEKINVDKTAVMNAINSAKEFAISINGEVLYPPFSKDLIAIHKGAIKPIVTTGLLTPKSLSLSELFGVGYKVEEEGSEVVFGVGQAWNEIVQVNLENANFDDSTSDGIMDLGDEELEAMSWHGVEWGVTNRHISDAIEANCEGTLYCYHTQSPFMFSSLLFIDDLACARKMTREMIVKNIEDKLAHDPTFSVDTLTEDEKEAAAYFGVL